MPDESNNSPDKQNHRFDSNDERSPEPNSSEEKNNYLTSESSSQKNNNPTSESQSSPEPNSSEEKINYLTSESSSSSERTPIEQHEPRKKSTSPSSKTRRNLKVLLWCIYILFVVAGCVFLFKIPVPPQLSWLSWLLSSVLILRGILIAVVLILSKGHDSHASISKLIIELAKDLEFSEPIIAIVKFFQTLSQYIEISAAIFGIAGFLGLVPIQPDHLTDLMRNREKLEKIELNWERLGQGESTCNLLDRSQPSKNGKELENSVTEADKLHWRFESYRSAQYAYVIASDVECDKENAKIYAEKSLNLGSKALEVIDEVERKSQESYKSQEKDVYNWMKTDFAKERVLFHNALGHSILYRLDDRSRQRKDEVKNSLNKITRKSFYEKNGLRYLDENRLIKPFLGDDDVLPSVSKHPCASFCQNLTKN